MSNELLTKIPDEFEADRQHIVETAHQSWPAPVAPRPRSAADTLISLSANYDGPELPGNAVNHLLTPPTI